MEANELEGRLRALERRLDELRQGTMVGRRVEPLALEGLRQDLGAAARHLQALRERLRRDLGQRQQAEEALRTNNNVMRAVSASLTLNVAVVDPAGAITAVNEAWERFAQENGGDPARTGVGVNYLEVCRRATGPHSEGALEALAGIQDVIAGSQVRFVLEYPLPGPKGLRWFSMYVTPSVAGPGAVVAHLDITERRRAEEALRRSQERYRDLVDNLDDIIWTLDPAGHITFVNAAAERITGAPAAAIIGCHFSDFMPPAEVGRTEALLREVLAGREVREQEIAVRDAAGREVFLSLSAKAVRAEDGRLEVRGTGRNVTERRRARELEEARRRNEERVRLEEQRAAWLASVLDQIPVGVLIARAPDARVVTANRAVQELTGKPIQYVAKGEMTLYWPLRRPDGRPVTDEELPLVRAICHGEHVHYEEYLLERPDGSWVTLMANAAPLQDGGQTVGGVLAFWDVTSWREAQRRLEEASQLKDEFLSVASHELKTPVTSIRLFSEMVARRPEAIHRRLLDTLVSQADQLVRLVNDLLDVSRIQLDRLPMETRPLNLARLVRDVCQRPLLRPRLIFCPPEEAVLMVEGDPMRLEQVVSNLLDNAVKFSPESSKIELRVARRDGKAVVEVQDQGPGIPPEHLPHIFERFYKPTPERAAYTGLGVGLYISKEIVERHGGRIWAESEPGKGSTFFVELPLAEN